MILRRRACPIRQVCLYRASVIFRRIAYFSWGISIYSCIIQQVFYSIQIYYISTSRTGLVWNDFYSNGEYLSISLVYSLCIGSSRCDEDSSLPHYCYPEDLFSTTSSWRACISHISLLPNHIPYYMLLTKTTTCAASSQLFFF